MVAKKPNCKEFNVDLLDFSTLPTIEFDNLNQHTSNDHSAQENETQSDLVKYIDNFEVDSDMLY